MQVVFNARHPEATELRDHSVSRVRFALRRLEALVPRAHVQMSDVNGPRDGVDKLCQVVLSTPNIGSVLVAAIARDWRVSLEDALGRAIRMLMRKLRSGAASKRPNQLVGHLTADS
jgi:hypothetical protein